MDLLGIPMKMKTTATTSYEGTESLTVKGQSTNCVKIKMAVSASTEFAGIKNELSSNSFFYIAPSIGFFAKMESPVSTSTITGGKIPGSVATTIDYTIVK